jgi:hypothetical protein
MIIKNGARGVAYGVLRGKRIKFSLQKVSKIRQFNNNTKGLDGA